LNRRRDIQLVLVFVMMVILGALLVFSAIHGLPLAIGIALIIVAIFVTWLVDVLTVRLVVAGKWRGFYGYEV
jgi:hypothetical protein